MEEALVKRIMPHSLEAEQSVIGSMIMDRDAILTASEQLVKDDFYHQQYGILFETITELFNSGAPVDLITLQNRLREKNVPPVVIVKNGTLGDMGQRAPGTRGQMRRGAGVGERKMERYGDAFLLEIAAYEEDAQ